MSLKYFIKHDFVDSKILMNNVGKEFLHGPNLRDVIYKQDGTLVVGSKKEFQVD